MTTVRAVSGNGLTLMRPASFTDVAVGSSIAVAGVCLSAVAVSDEEITFDVVEETKRRSTLGTLREGDRVNLERAMRADSRFDGHIVQGHTEGVGEVVSVERDGLWTVLAVRLPEESVPAVVSKGSIAFDGVSLTVVTMHDRECCVALIPHTCEHTTLGALKEGDRVNVETDILGRYICSLVSRHV